MTAAPKLIVPAFDGEQIVNVGGVSIGVPRTAHVRLPSHKHGPVVVITDDGIVHVLILDRDSDEIREVVVSFATQEKLRVQFVAEVLGGPRRIKEHS